MLTRCLYPLTACSTLKMKRSAWQLVNWRSGNDKEINVDNNIIIIAGGCDN